MTNLPVLCLAAAFALTLLSKLPVAVAMSRRPGGYDNRHPRDQQAELTGWGRRALAAHQNSFEAFAPFAAAILTAMFVGADVIWTSVLAVVFVTSRMLYVVFYVADLATLRSLVWTVGFAATLGLFVLALAA